ncbi:MAG TPA: HAD-IC family P-type ATPase [Thermomicrobiales bacterium]
MTSDLAEIAAVSARPWHSLDDTEVEDRLATHPGGLCREEVRARLARYGPNELMDDAGPSGLATLLDQVRSPLVVILVVAGVVTALLGEYADAVVIAVVVVLNTTVGFVQERQAERSVRALLLLVSPRARVVRDHADWEVESRELVPGDVVLLESGARVPADLRLTTTTALQVDESALTGESLPVVKGTAPLPVATGLADRTNLAYAGTTVTSGRGRGYVVGTGRQTELGTIAREVSEVQQTATPLQQRMERLARVIGVVVVGCALLAFALGMIGGRAASEMFLIAVALAVSAVPEGLPVAFTITLAAGVRRMARRRAIVRRLPSVETLGSTTVIGSDKTGTLTENVMTVRQVWTADGVTHLTGIWDGRTVDCAPVMGPNGHDRTEPRQLTLLTGILTNEAEVVQTADGIRTQGDPTEAALLIAASRLGLDPDEEREAYRMVAEVPFEPERQFSASVRQRDGTRLLLVKGAPERVLAMCDAMLTGHGPVRLDHDAVQLAAHDMASEGLRVLAMAHRVLPPTPVELDGLEEPSGLTLLGLQGMADPPREGARDAIAACRDAGMRVVMITGDHAATARAIGNELGIAEDDAAVATGVEVEAMDDAELHRRVGEVDVYARTAPEHKLRIVRAMQANGDVVAVTGDGVNDAPALKAADIGIAMGKRGTDAAKESADMVLADDNFVSIAAAVEEGRVTFDNIRKVVAFVLGTNAAEVLTIVIALALDWPLPLIAAQILWLNLVTDSLQVMALAFEPGEPDVMARSPRGRSAGILSRVMWERVGITSLVITVGTLFLFRWELDQTGSEGIAQTAALTTMVLFQMFQALNVRSPSRSLFRMHLFANPLLLVAIIASIAIHVIALYLPWTQYLLRVEPLDLAVWVRATLVASTVVAAAEVHKLLRRDGEFAS